MSYRSQIINQSALDVSSIVTLPVRPFLSAMPPPPKNADPDSAYEPEGVSNVHPGVMETVIRHRYPGDDNRPNYAASYVYRIDPSFMIFGVGMSPDLDQIVDIMRHPALGEQFTGLIAQYWPVTWSMMLAGRDFANTGYGLFQVKTDRPYWVMGHAVPYQSPEAAQVVNTVRMVAAKSLLELVHFPGNMPGIEALEAKSDSFTEKVQKADAVLGVLGKAVGIVASIVGMGGNQ